MLPAGSHGRRRKKMPKWQQSRRTDHCFVQKLQGLLNKNMRIRMTDSRTLVGLFLCTDRDCNVILGSVQEFLKSADTFSQTEPRVLGLAMIPGHHVVSIEAEADILDDAVRH
ncbi:N-alpha-acetyltransferase 38, NatC auxiliary subunit-like isoform X6 [Stigmatopora argus]